VCNEQDCLQLRKKTYARQVERLITSLNLKKKNLLINAGYKVASLSAEDNLIFSQERISLIRKGKEI
jgi:hypothetical protein